MSDEVVIRFDHVTKSYDLYKNDWGRFLGAFNIKGRNYEGAVKANEDLSFEIYKGEAVAFLGLNGAGKSTALKMITGVTHPTQGTVEVNGRVSALLELSAGFDAKLTGRENIRLRGQIMGLTDEEMAEIEPRAVEFADLGMYIDQPIRSYSSGMRSRLGFALAVSVEPEILVIDEALSVGDRRFKRRCIRRIREIMMNSEVTVLFVTHSSTMAQQFCSRGIVLEKGKKIFDGTMDDAMEFYESIA
ncbi:MAG TPA: teichoic acid ABC transporter ATP-binding protein [Eggerthellaceae bacterium]|nr:teichoic acid ABC transporter ATP-binding protein [Eggerthellaceae bacterium]